jgi:hypothetical protein
MVLGAWPGVIAFRLNAVLPAQYVAGPLVHLGTAIEIDVGAFDQADPPASAGGAGGVAVAWAPARPTLLLDTGTLDPPEYEVRVYDDWQGRRLVAAVELVSPGNKDRPESRESFVAKCHALLLQGVCLTVVDPVTNVSANLYAELAERLGADPPAVAGSPIYAVTCRRVRSGRRWRVEEWEHELAVGASLPTLPLWLTPDEYVPLELEATYEDTCRGLRIG